MATEFKALGATKNRFIIPGTVGGTHVFNNAIAQNQIETKAYVGALPHNRVEIKEVIMLSAQRLEYDVYLFKNNTYNTADVSTDTFKNSVNMNLTLAGRQIAGAGIWRLDGRLRSIMHYVDLTNTYTLYVGLIPRDGNKLAGAPGALTLQFVVTPSFG